MSKTRTRELPADLFADYRDYLELGAVPQNRLHEVVVMELFAKGITLQALKDFQNRRAVQLEAKAGRALECTCGLLCFDLNELAAHLEHLSSRTGHGLKGKRGGSRYD
jgi:hypothetical protein